MGFKDQEAVKWLLHKHQGCVKAVVKQLMQQERQERVKHETFTMTRANKETSAQKKVQEKVAAAAAQKQQAETLADLMYMGFEEETAKAALIHNDWKLKAAIKDLMAVVRKTAEEAAAAKKAQGEVA